MSTEWLETRALVAALSDDQPTLDRIARQLNSTERRGLTKALNRVYDALVGAERVELAASGRRHDADPLGSGHSPRATGHDVGDCGGGVEEPSTHLIRGSASPMDRENRRQP